MERWKHIGSRDIEAQRDVSHAVHGDTPKPPVVGIGRVSALLINFPWTPCSPPCCHAQLVPADARVIMRWVAVSRHGMVQQQALARAEIAIGETLHHIAIRKRIE